MEKRIESGLLQDFWCEGPVVVITDKNVAELYGKAFAERLNCPLIVFPAGEGSKTRDMKNGIEDRLLELGFGSDVTILALGGGVVTDLAGFVAATYCRGVKLKVFPTTLMAMCDAAIGGKNAVNVGEAKNAIGTIHHPETFLIDPDVLQSLPEEEYLAGTAEMLKHGLIWDRNLWDFLLKNLQQWKQRDGLFLQKCIAWNISIKTEVIATADRHILNFGHTVGHALEMMLEMKHGFAIALGMWIEALWSLGWNKEIEMGLHAFGFDLEWPDIDLETLWKFVQLDKKRRDGKVYAVKLEQIGKVKGLKEITLNALTSCLSLPA